MWHTQDIESIWEKLINGINNVCTTLVPSKIVQVRANFIPYKNSEIINKENEIKIQFQNATSNDNPDNWKILRESKNCLKTLWKKARLDYYAQELIQPRKVWNFIKTINGDAKISIPSTLIEDGKSIQSPSKIAAIMNMFWNVKIQVIHVAFKAIYFDPLIFLKALIPRPSGTFMIPQISTGDVIKIIKHSKNSSSQGHNETSMRFLKISPKAFAPAIAFAINRSLMEGIFPAI